MEELPDHPFWAFSLDFYARPGVADACLALQDKADADVNLILFCLWHGMAGHGRIDQAALAAAEDRVQTIREDLVLPLRALRRHLKGDIPDTPPDWREALRRHVADAEIEAEHLEQLILAGDLRTESGGSVEDAAANLALYLARLGVEADDPHAESLRAALTA
ncbi:MAG: TIGR02444 family protein [Alphaproteobacteria bacterium]|nr:TIGR02444 family protein [Alphaproteobacteria bacterium]